MQQLKQLVQKAPFTLLQTKDRDKALKTLVDSLLDKGSVINAKQFYTALLERESLISTGIGLGIAIPHARIESDCKDFFLAIGIHKGKSGIEWGSIDALPVRIVFLIGGPKDRQGDYLELLALITTFIKDFEIKEKVLNTSCHQDMMDLFS
ncbi:PTS sugar transporter subunit IIA [Candidatus Aerophobetes bacterium]|uniref:PTS sugar transporter subunit IIA n=1 Tax=Aerophobetes bacterium TaxID=2030807 RepID=A0A2A4WY48_UNCAE|nr:MAG: PTS sugar transporter subunit IIA [Candidatus Aerophobetes bacterium]